MHLSLVVAGVSRSLSLLRAVYFFRRSCEALVVCGGGEGVVDVCGETLFVVGGGGVGYVAGGRSGWRRCLCVVGEQRFFALVRA